MQNWWQDSVADCFMQLTLFDIYHALPARHQPWFRETRQGWVNATFEEVQEDTLLLKTQPLSLDTTIVLLAVAWAMAAASGTSGLRGSAVDHSIC